MRLASVASGLNTLVSVYLMVQKMALTNLVTGSLSLGYQIQETGYFGNQNQLVLKFCCLH